jgi:subtilisin family serine protease
MTKPSASSRRLLAALLTTAFLAACGGGGGGSSSTPQVNRTATPTPTSTPTTSPTGFSQTAFSCPTSATTFAVARDTAPAEATRRSAARPSRDLAASAGRIAVTYDRGTARSAAATIQSRERTAGAASVQELDFPNTNTLVHVLTVAPAQVESAMAALRSQAGVVNVSTVGRRHRTTVNAGYFPNDGYFTGFTTAQNLITQPTAAPAPPQTFKVPPYEEAANVPGQWDMHAIGLEKAFAYSQAGNGSGVAVNAGALGLASVKIAIIDTGVDPNHPELSGKLAYQKCFITNPNGVQSTSSFSTDPDGHGTDVAGIAGAAMNNNLGFVGVGGNVTIYGYRVFPTPDDNCANDNNTDVQCSVDTADIASAINDAIAQGVNVISMSLGGGRCGTGPGFATNGDNDTTEGNAVANAIAHNIVVVAAAGNDGSQGVEAPGCDQGVIAVGATSLADGQPNGLGNSNGTTATPIEYVASYSDYGSPGALLNSSSAWGIVAPGGDPSGNSDNDDLHWIEHIWTSTPFKSTPTDTNFIGNCTQDYGLASGTGDCRTLIAGTSMSTPHVAGAAALIISATGGTYANPTAMKLLLCQTADDLGDGHQGCGRLNIYRAMAKALGDAHLP